MSPEDMEVLRASLERGVRRIAQDLGGRPISVDWTDSWGVDGLWSSPWYYIHGEISLNRNIVDSWYAELPPDVAELRTVGLGLQDLATHLFQPNTQAWADAMLEAAFLAADDGADDTVWDVVNRTAGRLEGHRVENLLAERVPEAVAPLRAWAVAYAERIRELEGPSAAGFFLMGRRYLPEHERRNAVAAHAEAFGNHDTIRLMRLISTYQEVDPQDLDALSDIALQTAKIEHPETFGCA
jgi:hypothetical protein